MVQALENRPCAPLPPPSGSFEGAGIYALYYFGDNPTYRLLAEMNRDQGGNPSCRSPIYVGSAAPEGSRKGDRPFDAPPGARLYARLRDHAASIRVARDLNLEHFACRYLVTSELWFSLAERLLIARYKPVWNVVVDGFGLHRPGSIREEGAAPAWDILHSGRPWAETMRSRGFWWTPEQMREAIRCHLAGEPLPLIPSRPGRRRRVDGETSTDAAGT